MTPQLKHKIKTYIDTNPPGWCWEDKAVALAESVLVTHASVVVELGIFGGRSLIPLAYAARDSACIAWGIDTWRKESAIATLDPVADALHIQWWSTVDLEAVQARVADDIWRLGLNTSCAIIRTTSQIASTLFAFGEIGVLHIDGCHTEKQSCEDVETWLPLCAHGAHIWFDDSNWASTQRAVELLHQQCSCITTLSNPAIGGEAKLFIKR